VDVDGQTCGYQVHEPGDGVERESVAVIPIWELCVPASRFAPFICKVDIEGAERELFDGARWADSFPVVMIEPHDYLYPGKGIARGLWQWVADTRRDVVVKGDGVFAIDCRALGL
jgi:hypothetical protein